MSVCGYTWSSLHWLPFNQTELGVRTSVRNRSMTSASWQEEVWEQVLFGNEGGMETCRERWNWGRTGRGWKEDGGVGQQSRGRCWRIGLEPRSESK